MGIKTVKAIELILDWNLWPRQAIERLDSTNVARMKASLRAGFDLPPVVANTKDYRVVDGFHRTTAVLSVFGDDAKIKVDFREYKDDAEMFLEAGRLNAYQGLTLSPKDRAHFILKCRKMKIPPAAIADALHIDKVKMDDFVAKRSATTEAGEKIPLPAGARNLAGKTLTETQEHYARTANGCLPEMYASMLINALKADALIMTEKTIIRLCELRDLLDVICSEAA